MKLSGKLGKNLKVQGIYLITVAEHHYIGSAICIRTRIRDHRKDLRKGVHYNTFMQNCFAKHGEGQFDFHIIKYCPGLTRDELFREEERLISTLHSDLNISKEPGLGNNSDIFRKKVYKYSLQGDFINEYISVSEAKRQTGIEGIQHVANTRLTAYKSVGGYRWSYEKFSRLTEYNNGSAAAKAKKVYCYDSTGNLHSEYKSLADCARILFPKKDLASVSACISGCTKGKMKNIEGYKFFSELQ